jgi:hypothetical protein
MNQRLGLFAGLAFVVACPCLITAVQKGADADLFKAVTLYASYDESLEADFAGGERMLSTRSNHPSEKGKFVFAKGFDGKVFRIAKSKGVAGGCLHATDVLPDNGRVFYPAPKNLAYQKGGWGGAVSVWIDTDPNKLLKTPFCDPIQITQRGALNGGIWFDFNNAKPRDLRLGVFPAVPEGQKPMTESDPNAPMVRVPKIDFKAGTWHHVVLNWKNFDTGKPDAHAALYIDGKHIGDVKDRAIAMGWELDKAGIYVAVSYIGLLDELAVFNRPLTTAEIATLHSKPGCLSSLKRAK